MCPQNLLAVGRLAGWLASEDSRLLPALCWLWGHLVTPTLAEPLLNVPGPVPRT